MFVVDNASARSAEPSSPTPAGSRRDSAESRSYGFFDAAPLEPRALRDRLSTTEARERTLIAEAIHHDPLQLLLAAVMHVDRLSVKQPDTRQECDTVNDLLESAVEKLRTLIVATSVPDFDSGLASVLRRLSTGIFVGTSIAVQLTGAANVPLTVDAQNAAYRIVREALVNVRQHALARHVWIDVVSAGKTVVITVADDGIGCERPQSSSGHLGLPAMHSRARSAGGRVRINGTCGVGTTVTLTLPRADRT